MSREGVRGRSGLVRARPPAGAGARSLPEQVHLPSGRVVRLSDRAARAAHAAHAAHAANDGAAKNGAAKEGAAKEGAGEPRNACLRDLRVLQGAGVLADEGGAPLDPLGLSLSDAHVLRALLAWAGVVPEEAGQYTCANCDAPFEVAPSGLLEIGPFTDGELHDPELDRAFHFDAWHAVPAFRVGRAVCRRVKLAPRTLEEALPLFRAAGGRELRLTPAVVAAMGVVALGQERRAGGIADALAEAPEEAWAAVVELYHQARYPARLVAVHRCGACGARNDLDVPLEREIDRAPVRALAPRKRRGEGDRFPDLDEFERRVRAAAERVYRARGVRNIDLFIDAGVPLCDDGGEPLLGCYTPGGADPDLGLPRPPEIRIFYKTFEAEHREDPGFDVDAEIAETVDHEVTHHLHHLAGSDPLDEEERGEIEAEEVRRVGRAESARRARRGIFADLAGFLRVTWPLWAVAAAATALSWC